MFKNSSRNNKKDQMVRQIIAKNEDIKFSDGNMKEGGESSSEYTSSEDESLKSIEFLSIDDEELISSEVEGRWSSLARKRNSLSVQKID